MALSTGPVEAGSKLPLLSFSGTVLSAVLVTTSEVGVIVGNDVEETSLSGQVVVYTVATPLDVVVTVVQAQDLDIDSLSGQVVV